MKKSVWMWIFVEMFSGAARLQRRLRMGNHCLGGMNEKGLAVSVNMIQDSDSIEQDMGKPGWARNRCIWTLTRRWRGGWVDSIRAFGPDIIIGYPSAIKILGELVENGQIEMNVVEVAGIFVLVFLVSLSLVSVKEGWDIETERCFFNLRYPFWHDHGLTIRDSRMTELCRAALWYSNLSGKCSFQYIRNAVFENCAFDTRCLLSAAVVFVKKKNRKRSFRYMNRMNLQKGRKRQGMKWNLFHLWTKRLISAWAVWPARKQGIA